MKKLVFASVALCVFAIADFAVAADLPIYTKAPPPVLPVWTWTGFYVGGNVGYSWGRAATDFSESSTSTSVVTATTTGGLPIAGNGLTATTAASAFGSAASHMDGWLGGVQAGYNWQIQQWVLGLEADIQATGEKDDPIFCSVTGCPAGSAIGTSTTKLPWFGTVRGRVGYSWNYAPNRPILFYATGGLAYGEVDASYTGGLVGGPLSAVNISSTRTGWTVGGGGEGRLGDTNWTLKVEYLYMDFGTVSGAVAATGAPVVTLFGINNSDLIHHLTTTTSIAGTASTHVTDQLVRVGINYKFPPL
jgi:outer membrane immunogenic protein